MSNKLKSRHKSHDHLFRRAMEDKRVAKEFFELHLPAEIRALVQLDTLEFQKESYIDDELKLHQVDVLYQTTFADQLGYFYLLVEHQSTIDSLMPFRFLKYTVKIIADHLRKYGGTELPIVYPILFYQGKVLYSAPTDLFVLFGQHQELARKIFLQPHFLIDLGRIPDEALKAKLWAGTLEFIFKHVQAREFLRYLESLKPQLIQIEKEDKSFLIVLLQYVMTHAERTNTHRMLKFAKDTFSPEIGDKAMITIADQLRAEGRLEGERKGELKGELKGKKELMVQIAIKMLKSGFPTSAIIDITGFSPEKIQELQMNHSDIEVN